MPARRDFFLNPEEPFTFYPIATFWLKEQLSKLKIQRCSDTGIKLVVARQNRFVTRMLRFVNRESPHARPACEVIADAHTSIVQQIVTLTARSVMRILKAIKRLHNQPRENFLIVGQRQAVIRAIVYAARSKR